MTANAGTTPCTAKRTENAFPVQINGNRFWAFAGREFLEDAADYGRFFRHNLPVTRIGWPLASAGRLPADQAGDIDHHPVQPLPRRYVCITVGQGIIVRRNDGFRPCMHVFWHVGRSATVDRLDKRCRRTPDGKCKNRMQGYRR